MIEQKRKEEDEKKEKEQDKIKTANIFYQKENENYLSKKLSEIQNKFDINNFYLNQSEKLKPFIYEQISKIFKHLDNKFNQKIKETYKKY